MANNPYVNKVIYGNQTVMDISGDTVTPADVASGKTFHDASGEAQTGSYVAPTITDITPSNASPVPLFALENYHIIGNNGYAIDDYDSVAPTSQSPSRISVGEIIKVTYAPGYLVPGFTEISPNNDSITPLSASAVYKPRNNGVAVRSIDVRAADDTDPPYLDVGNIYKIQTTGGYLYATQQSGGIGPAYTKTGTLPDFTAINTEQTVDTGLSSITYFYIEAKVVGANLTNIRYRAWLDTTQTANKQIAAQVNTTNTTTSAVNSGTDADGVITGNSVYIKVSGISGGVVTIKTGNNVSYLHKDIVWYAG